MASLPCFLCGEELDQRIDKNGKPYFICDPCGVQTFIRRKQGIANLERLKSELREHKPALDKHTEALFRMRRILDGVNAVEGELNKLDDSFSNFSKQSKDKKRARTLLERRKRTLLRDLEHVGE